MLVLTRKRNEKIVIGDSITITIVDIRGGKIRIGIDAPKDVTVHRQEIYDAIQQERDLKTSAADDEQHQTSAGNDLA